MNLSWDSTAGIEANCTTDYTVSVYNNMTRTLNLVKNVSAQHTFLLLNGTDLEHYESYYYTVFGVDNIKRRGMDSNRCKLFSIGKIMKMYNFLYNVFLVPSNINSSFNIDNTDHRSLIWITLL